MTAPNTLTAALDQIRERAKAVSGELTKLVNAAIDAGTAQLPTEVSRPAVLARIASSFDVPRLIAAIEAVLDGHEPVPTYGPALNPDGSSACDHDPDDGRHFEISAGEWVCQGDPGPPVCARCSDTLLDEEEAEWPCGIYAAITAALTGKGGSDEQ